MRERIKFPPPDVPIDWTADPDEGWRWGGEGRLVWKFQAPTRVFRFELKEDNGEGQAVSLTVAGEEQLIGGSVPLSIFGAPGMPSLALPAQKIGAELVLTVQHYTGRIRPIGRQIP